MLCHQPRETRGPIETWVDEEGHGEVLDYAGATSRAKRAALLKLAAVIAKRDQCTEVATSRAKRAALLKLQSRKVRVGILGGATSRAKRAALLKLRTGYP